MKCPRLSLETVFYWSLLLVLLAAPVVVEWFDVADSSSGAFVWASVLRTWRRLAPYVVVFVVHDQMLAPLLLRGGRSRWLYFISVAAICALFFLYECRQGPPKGSPFGRDRMERASQFDRPQPGQPHEGFDDRAPAEGPMAEGPMRRGPFGDEPPGGERPLAGAEERMEPHGPQGPLPMGLQRELWDTLLLLLMLGMNIGVKLYFKRREDARRMAALERANLEHRLAQLRYQLNPHFLMNTLNNIHALIDIDPAEAQAAVVELSRLLRFMLYETDRERVALRRDLEFLQHYVTLMRLRYADVVRVNMQLPATVPDVEVPPLLTVSFVENAFKHGVSYRSDSFVDISVVLNDEVSALTFECRNSRHEITAKDVTDADAGGGIGLTNIRQRLDLLYGDRYSLVIDDATAGVYSVRLTIPLDDELRLVSQ